MWMAGGGFRPGALIGQTDDYGYNITEQPVHIHDLRTDTYPWADLFARLRTCTAPGFTGWTLLEEGKVPADVVAAMRENSDLWGRLAKARPVDPPSR
jgi:hypothetical protein